MRDEFKSYCHEGAHHTIVINNRDKLTKEETLEVLNKLLNAVKTQRLSYVDSEQIGNKYTHCNWGVCTDSLEVYSKPEMHTFPQDFVDYKRESSLSLMKGVACPMKTGGQAGHGCFYTCKVFQRKYKTPTREQAIKLYEDVIKAVEDMDDSA